MYHANIVVTEQAEIEVDLLGEVLGQIVKPHIEQWK